MAQRPRPFGLDGYRARVIRGPHRADADQWYWRVEHYGESGGESVGAFWGTRREAEARLSVIMATPRVRRTRVPEAPKTIQQLLDVWMGTEVETRPAVPENTVRCYASSCDRVNRLIGDEPLHQLTSRTLRDYCSEYMQSRDGRGAGTALLDCTIVRAAWNWGRRVGVVAGANIDVPTIRNVRSYPRRTPSNEEVARVMNALRTPWHRVALRLMHATGARPSEIAALRWDDVELRGAPSGLWLGRHPGARKTGERWFPLTPEIAGELVAWRLLADGCRETVLGVHPKTGRSIGGSLASACDRAGVPRFSPGSLRRLATETLYRKGIAPDVEAKLLGHSVKTAMLHYRELSPADLTGAVHAAGMGSLPALPEEA